MKLKIIAVSHESTMTICNTCDGNSKVNRMTKDTIRYLPFIPCEAQVRITSSDKYRHKDHMQNTA